MTAQTAGAEAPSGSASFSFAAFAAAADRLELVLDGESGALERNQPCDLALTCQRKRQSLLELSRFLPRAAGPAERDAAHRRLDGLSLKLERNRRALDVQLLAVREIADIIARTMREAESDGTYSQDASRR